MRHARCHRAWQVEAIYDGRLLEKSRLEAEQHVESCPDCRLTRHDLQRFTARVRASAPATNELALRRLRQSTLAKADAELRGSIAPVARTRLLLWPAILATIGLLSGAWLWLRSESQLTSGVEIEASTAAVWTRLHSAQVEYIDLGDGMLRLTVRRNVSSTRLVVRVPDGEVEDTGTTFQVWVSDGQTRHIAVSEGSVVFRRLHDPAIVVRAGELWSSAAVPAQPASSVSDQGSTPMTPPGLPAPTRVAPPRQRTSASKPAVSVPQLAVAPSDPAERGGATDEDLAYLGIVALLRESRDEEARLAARDYLRRFPTGFRRVEIERIAGSAAP